MEYGMDLHRRRELQAIGLETNPLFDDVGTKAFPSEFLGGALYTILHQ
jgi:hypothetical protein